MDEAKYLDISDGSMAPPYETMGHAGTKDDPFSRYDWDAYRKAHPIIKGVYVKGFNTDEFDYWSSLDWEYRTGYGVSL